MEALTGLLGIRVSIILHLHESASAGLDVGPGDAHDLSYLLLFNLIVPRRRRKEGSILASMRAESG